MASLNTSLLMTLLADAEATDGGAVFQPKPLITIREFLLSGTGAGKADVSYGPKRRTLASGIAEELDLRGGLLDMNGNAAVFVRVNLLYVRSVALKTDAGAVLEIGGTIGTVENFKLFKSTDDIYKLGPGGLFLVYEPSAAALPTVAGTEDLLRIANVSSPAASISYDILIVGGSA